MPVQNESRRKGLAGTYIEPLRSAILIDDQFPRYEDLLADPGASKSEAGRAYDKSSVAHLLEICRARALMCDVENDASRVLEGDQLSHVLKSDLVVLDYHLNPRDDRDPSAALEVVTRLAESPHANLVVIYTRSDLRDALVELAVRFRGIDVGQTYADDVAAELAEWEPDIDRALLHALISGDVKQCKKLCAPLRKELDELGIPKGRQSHAINVRLESWLARNYGHLGAPKSVVRSRLEMSAESSEVMWLSCHNVFVTFVTKSPDADIFQALEDALVAWDPGAIRVLLARARTHLEQGGFEYETTAAGPAEWQVGVLYHVLAGEEPDSRVRLSGLLGRLFEALQKELTAKVSEFGQGLLDQEIGAIPSGPANSVEHQAELMTHARKLSRTGDHTKTEKVLLSLNAFLCSTAFHGSHLQTGTVFRDLDSDEWWLCVTPACELVPRQPSDGTWQHDLYPCFPAQALRLTKQGAHSALSEATRAGSIFISKDKEIVILRVVDANSKLPVPILFVLADEGKTDEAHRFVGYAVVRNSAGATAEPVFAQRRFEAVAQLRHEYADRLLQQTGQHTSRIGVDFVDLRTSSN